MAQHPFACVCHTAASVTAETLCMLAWQEGMRWCAGSGLGNCRRMDSHGPGLKGTKSDAVCHEKLFAHAALHSFLCISTLAMP